MNFRKSKHAQQKNENNKNKMHNTKKYFDNEFFKVNI